MNIACQVCGSTFQAKPYQRRKYCSKKCYGTTLVTRIGKLCARCGAPFQARRDAVEQGWGTYCSQSCASQSRGRPLAERFAEYAAQAVRTEHGCLLWPGPLDNGYAIISDRGHKQLRVSHLSYAMRYGPLPAGAILMHTCDTPACFEPTHLVPGSHTANIADRDAKGRQARGERNGQAKLTDDSVRAIRREVASGVSQSEVGRRFAITQAAVWAIVRRRSWKHVE